MGECNQANNYVTKAVMAVFKFHLGRHGTAQSAKRAMVYMYRKGTIVGDVDWRMVWADHPFLGKRPMPDRCPADMPLPVGWSLKNLKRCLKAEKAGKA